MRDEVPDTLFLESSQRSPQYVKSTETSRASLYFFFCWCKLLTVP
jgi:hypothetical protein